MSDKGSEDEVALLGSKPRFFDPTWYIANQPDVLKTGLDPATHFLQFGAAEGRDPSPHFNVKWYVEQYGDVIAGGANPLIHYLRWGASEGLHPTPAEMLKSKAIPSQETVEKLLAGFKEPEARPSQKASPSNCYALRTKWARYFLTRGIAYRKSGHLENALTHIEHAIQICPDSAAFFAIYADTFRTFNRDCVRRLEQYFSRAKLLIVHVSCKSKISFAQKSAESFADLASDVLNLIVVADEQIQKRRYLLDNSNSVLTVPANDSYEGLTEKVLATFMLLGHSSCGAPILKVDDDISCCSLRSLKADMRNIVSAYDYGGNVYYPRHPYEGCRFWHFEKCASAYLNNKPSAVFFSAPYAQGPFYWLSSGAVNLLSKLAVLHEDHFSIYHGYEDLAIGTALREYGITPFHQDLIATGSLQKHEPL